MRTGDLRLQTAYIVFKLLGVLRIRIALVHYIFASAPVVLVDVGARNFIRRHNAVFCPCFDGHIAHCHSAIHGKAADYFTGKLHCFVAGAGHADLPYRVKDQILAGTPWRQFPAINEFNRLRHF